MGTGFLIYPLRKFHFLTGFTSQIKYTIIITMKKKTYKNNLANGKRFRPTFDDDFIQTDTWRVFRIMSEFVEGLEGLSSVQQGVSFFG